VQAACDKDHSVSHQAPQAAVSGAVRYPLGFARLVHVIEPIQHLNRGNMVTVNHALEKRERNREAKAMTAAKLEKSLEQELVSRLKSRAYGDAPLNVNEEVWAKILEADRAGPGGEELMEDETDEEDEEELEREFVSDVEESEDEEGFEDWAGRSDVRCRSFSRGYILLNETRTAGFVGFGRRGAIGRRREPRGRRRVRGGRGRRGAVAVQKGVEASSTATAASGAQEAAA
jgi:hypothetical protein